MCFFQLTLYVITWGYKYLVPLLILKRYSKFPHIYCGFFQTKQASVPGSTKYTLCMTNVAPNVFFFNLKTISGPYSVWISVLNNVRIYFTEWEHLGTQEFCLLLSPCEWFPCTHILCVYACACICLCVRASHLLLISFLGYPNIVATYGRGYTGFAPSYSYQFPGEFKAFFFQMCCGWFLLSTHILA